ncbi:sigma-fimbriae tip adhesin [alpha proteobacterium U9-1i]|nr:sigma-fimbriae tip adhesin [alpha proteobacterium U9-1i]
MFSLLARRAILGLALTAAAAFNAHAATDSDTMAITATVVASCSVDASDLLFGDYDPVAASPLDIGTSIGVTCTNGTAYVVSLDEGLGAGATVASRRMTAGADTLTYSLYRNAGRTNVWGETAGVNTVAGTGSGAEQDIDVFGRVPANQTAPAGAFSDTVTVTVTY